MDNEEIKKEALLNFPCEFLIKVFGNNTDQFEMEVITLIRKHTQLKEDAITNRLSKDQKYLALTVKIDAQSREQLDDIYRELSSSPLVLMAL